MCPGHSVLNVDTIECCPTFAFFPFYVSINPSPYGNIPTGSLGATIPVQLWWYWYSFSTPIVWLSHSKNGPSPEVYCRVCNNGETITCSQIYVYLLRSSHNSPVFLICPYSTSSCWKGMPLTCLPSTSLRPSKYGGIYTDVIPARALIGTQFIIATLPPSKRMIIVAMEYKAIPWILIVCIAATSTVL